LEAQCSVATMSLRSTSYRSTPRRVSTLPLPCTLGQPRSSESSRVCKKACCQSGANECETKFCITFAPVSFGQASRTRDAIPVVYVRRIGPAFEWAQSVNEIMLNVKFAHKLDAPATLGCKKEEVNINTTYLSFQVACKAKKKRFGLQLDLLRAVDPDSSSWSMASVGRATFTLKKKTPGPWSRLLRSRSKLPRMHRWWSMAE